MKQDSIYSLFVRFIIKSTLLFFVFTFSNDCIIGQMKISPGAESYKIYLPMLKKDKKVGVVAHQASLLFNKIENQHLVDFLVKNEVDVKKIFAPEHGFRGKADAGEKIRDYYDNKTGIPIISLYGKNKKPSKENLKDIDIVIFDLQDVGVRFYTYISTLHYVMQSCAEFENSNYSFRSPKSKLALHRRPCVRKRIFKFCWYAPCPYCLWNDNWGICLNDKW